MQMRRRSSGAPATDTATSTGTSGKGGGALGPDNSLLQSMIPDSSQQESGFLGSFEQGQAPPELERVEGPEHQEAVELAVEEAVGQAPATEQAPAGPTIAPIAMSPEAEAAKQEQTAGPTSATARQAPAPTEQLPATQAGGKGSRPLTEAEIAYARRIYGDSIDYSKVRMTSDHWLSTGAPKTIGNTMHMRSDWGGATFDANGQLTEMGKDMLVHEIGHVWQYQNGGAAYIGDSLWAQLKGWIGGGSRDEAYDWRDAVKQGAAWKDWNPEQQAEAIEAYNDILQAEESGWASSSDKADKALLQPYIDEVRAGKGAPQFSTPGAVGGGLAGAGVGAGIGALVGGPIGALVGAGIGALVGGWFGGG